MTGKQRKQTKYQIDENFRMAKSSTTVAGYISPITNDNWILGNQVYSKFCVPLEQYNIHCFNQFVY